MESLGIFSSIIEVFDGVFSFLSTYSIVFLLLSALVGFFFALYGFKMFKVFVAFSTGCAGFTLGFTIGGLIAAFANTPADWMETLMEWLPIILAVLFAIWLASWGYRNPFGLIKFSIGCSTYIGSCLFFVAQFENIEETWFLSCILLPIIITAIVCWLVGLFLTAVVILLTAFGGAYLGVSSLLTLLHIPFAGIISIILAIVGGFFCLVFQAKNTMGKKVKLKDFVFQKK